MKNNRILILISLLIPVMLFAQDEQIHNFDANTFVEFREITEEFETKQDYYEDVNKDADYYISLKNYGYLFLAKNLCKIREIDPYKKRGIVSAYAAIGYGDLADSIFNKEVLLETDLGKFWIPTQDILIPYWQQENECDSLTLVYVRIHGYMKDSISDTENDKWLIFMNEFNSNVLDGLWDVALDHLNSDKDLIGLRCIEKLIELYPEDGRNYSLLAFYFYKTAIEIDNPDTKEEYYYKSDSLFQISMKLAPDFSYQYVQRAQLCYIRADYSETWKMIEKARELNDPNISDDFIIMLEAVLPYNDYKN